MVGPYVLTDRDKSFLANLEQRAVSLTARVAALSAQAMNANTLQHESLECLRGVAEALLGTIHEACDAPLFVTAPVARERLSSQHSYASQGNDVLRYAARMKPLFLHALPSFLHAARRANQPNFADRADRAVNALFTAASRASELHRQARAA